MLDRGEIVERGTHDELVAREGPYRRIYDVQMRDQEEFIAARTGAARPVQSSEAPVAGGGI